MCLCTCARHNAVEVATDEVAEHDGNVKAEDIAKVGKKKFGGDGEVIESVGHAVGETTDNEEGDTEEGGEHIALARKGYGGRHNESATDGKQSAAERTDGEATFKDALCRFLQGVLRNSCQERHEQATEDVTKEHEDEMGHFVALDETCKTGVEAKAVVDYRKESEGKEDASDNVASSEVTKTCNAHAYATKH